MHRPPVWGFLRTVASKKDVSMAKLNLGSYPHLLGFEQLERLLERAAKSGNEGYPPFNIEQTSASSYRISLPLRGFARKIYRSRLRIANCLFGGGSKRQATRGCFCIAGSGRGSFNAVLFWPTVWMWAKRSWKMVYCILIYRKLNPKPLCKRLRSTNQENRRTVEG